ncbi:hypothetical protein GGH19_000762 [Coemansia sp. RSA 1807]|nr:hypothetical protein EV181_002632 [Coemansia sp. RSA 532]KAJ2196395.1 hypothetical protein IW144_002951 [Coemansia sp. RSA 522]KAJ2245537.1 hypothetical protein GGH98_004538 [Coemansia sp. RSA 454]KAJ2278636.1 hypothetical protein GGH14_002963 [Coemansia sp. RSA 370]KAJ2407710.1 hypothetical protein J3F80_002627 [Coemansia sp. RSA 2526]KAJ2433524.1 hypothetical protein IWW41_002016 [Coemansia sp. RSA 2522]KAJ2445454.1 hypothetical protein IWW46_001482 [Coemansia sp. RSA 2440]KAJ2534202.1 
MFGCIVAGRLVQTNLQQVDVNKYVFELPEAQTINHIVVFLLGTNPFEPGYAATVHLLWPNKSWQLLGMLSNDKPSAIFRLKATPGSENNMVGPTAELGISIEPIQAIEQQMQQQQMQQQQMQQQNALVPAGQQPSSVSLQSAKQIAERTLQSLYDYATSFATKPDASMGMFGSGAPVQVLPVKVFEDWYTSFLRKLQRDPATSMQN